MYVRTGRFSQLIFMRASLAIDSKARCVHVPTVREMVMRMLDSER